MQYRWYFHTASKNINWWRFSEKQSCNTYQKHTLSSRNSTSRMLATKENVASRNVHKDFFIRIFYITLFIPEKWLNTKMLTLWNLLNRTAIKNQVLKNCLLAWKKNAQDHFLWKKQCLKLYTYNCLPTLIRMATV